MANDLLRTTTSEATARLRGRRLDALIAGDSLTRFWPDIDATVADTLVTTLRGVTTVTDPQADGQTLAGTWAVSDVTSEANDRRSVTITQKLTLITSVTVEADLPTPIDEGRKVVMDAFALEEGTDNHIMYTYKYLDPTKRGDMLALSITAPSGYEEKDRRFDVEDPGDRTGTLRVLWRKVEWVAWGHDAYAPDITDISNSGRDNERRVKIWYGIQKADQTQALADIQTDGGAVAADADFHVTEARIADNKDGSLTITQVEIRRTTEVAGSSGDGELDGEELVRPHDFQSGTLDNFRSVYENYTADELGSLSETTPDGYKRVKRTTGINERGLYEEIWFYEKITWVTWSNADPDHISEANAENNRKQKTKVWEGIRSTDAATALAAICGETGGVPSDAGYHVTTARIINNHDGSITVVQEQLSADSTTADGDGLLDGQDIVGIFSLEPGTLDKLRTVYENYDEDDLTGISEATPAGYTLLTFDTVPNGATGNYNRIYDYRKITWPEWGHDDYAADLEDTGGIAGEREIITKTWENIQNDDLDEALVDLKDGLAAETAPEDGYIIVTVQVRDNNNGSLTFQQTQKKQVDNKDADDQVILKPFSIESGTLDEIKTIYDDFTAAGLAAAVSGESIPAGYTRVAKPEEIKGNGYWRQVFVYRKATWANTLDASNYPSRSENTYDGGVNAENNHGRRRVDVAAGVPIADAEDAVAAWGNNDDDEEYAVEGVSYVDAGNGEAIVKRNRVKYNFSAVTGSTTGHVNPLMLETVVDAGGRKPGMVRVWKDLRPADADHIISGSQPDLWETGTDYEVDDFVRNPDNPTGELSQAIALEDFTGGATFLADLNAGKLRYVGNNQSAATNFQPGSILYTHVSVRRVSDRDGRVTVIQTGVVEKNDFWLWFNDEEEDYFKQEFFTDRDGDVWRRTVGRLVTTSRTAAREYANESTAIDGRPVLDGGNSSVRPQQTVEWNPSAQKWVAVRIIWENDTDNGLNENMSDLVEEPID